MLLFPAFLLILSLNLLESRRHLTHSLLNLAVGKDPSWLIQPESKFDPYADNGGTVIGLAGRDFCIIASDTRLSDSYVIKSRNISRIFEINDHCAITASGCWADVIGLVNVLKRSSLIYEWECKEEIDCLSLAHLLSVTLYSKRFFPFFTFCLLGGVDKTGQGALFKYDALGSYERVTATVSGKGEELIQPILDKVSKMEEDKELWQFESLSEDGNEEREHVRFVDISIDRAIELVKTAFEAAAEREISVGDGLQIVVIENEVSSGAESRFSVKARNLWFHLPKH